MPVENVGCGSERSSHPTHPAKSPNARLEVNFPMPPQPDTSPGRRSKRSRSACTMSINWTSLRSSPSSRMFADRRYLVGSWPAPRFGERVIPSRTDPSAPTVDHDHWSGRTPNWSVSPLPTDDAAASSASDPSDSRYSASFSFVYRACRFARFLLHQSSERRRGIDLALLVSDFG